MKTGRLHTNLHQKTVDTQHMQHIKSIKTRQQTIASLKEKLCTMSANLAVLESQLPEVDPEERDNLVTRIIHLKDEKLELEDQISKLACESNELAYLENNATILYNYYDLVENGNLQQLVAPVADGNDIMSYFTRSPRKSSPLGTSPPAAESRGNLLERYMSQTDANFIKPFKCRTGDDVCEYCNSKDITVMLNDGYKFCNSCYTIEYIIADHDKPSYRDPPKEISYFAYKRINHYAEFSDVVGRLQVWVISMSMSL